MWPCVTNENTKTVQIILKKNNKVRELTSWLQISVRSYNNQSRVSWARWRMPLIPVFGRQREVDLCGFEASLVYKASSRTARAAYIEKLCLKKTIETNKKGRVVFSWEENSEVGGHVSVLMTCIVMTFWFSRTLQKTRWSSSRASRWESTPCKETREVGNCF